MTKNAVLSPQEEWIINGQADQKGRKRILNMLEAVRKNPMKVDVSRARLFTESFRVTEGQPLVLRWAKALQHIAENMPLFIGDDELIVGRGAGYFGRYGILYPEIDGAYLSRLKEIAPTRAESPFIVSAEDARVISEEIAPYWAEKSYTEAYARALPEDTRKLIFGHDPENFYTQRYILTESTTMRSSLNWNHDYAKVIERGFGDLKREARERLDTLNDPKDIVEKGPFLQAAIISCDAVVTFARRYAQLAMEMAKKENNLQRRKELMEIAKVCSRVPENPARSFREALQAQWFTQIFSRLEQNIGGTVGNGRMDQYLYPLYKKDIQEGRITPEAATELLECVWLGLSQALIAFISPSGASIAEGYAHFEALTLGGKTREGNDATNELSYLILKSKQGLPLNYPDLAVRIHSRTPDRFLHEVAEIIKEGQGYPKLFNDEEVIPLNLAKGAPLAEANDYCVSGCTEVRMVNLETYANGCCAVNLAAVLEMALNDGKMKKFGGEQIGLKTGDPRNFATFEELFAAYRDQHEYFIKHIYIQQLVADKVKPNFLAAPYCSILSDICREKCRDIHSGYIEDSFREQYVDIIGFGTVIDSLAAIKKLVYDEKKISLGELLEAMDADFEGKEALRQMCLNSPAYCNNDSYADSIGRRIESITVEYCHNHHGLSGEMFSQRIVPITLHIPAGKVVGAMPNGRKAGQYLSEGSSASHGADTKGPTAIFLSNAGTKCEGYKERAARLLNVKFSPATVAGEEGTRKLMSFIRTWCDVKLWHLQFNIINRETLLAAQKDPEKYRNLIVRVAGYSAYFVDLTPALQNEIISRTEHVM